MTILRKYTAIPFFALFVTTSVAAADSISVVSFGGQYATSQIEAYHKPFQEKAGVDVHSIDYNGGLAEVRAQVESGNVTWDVLDVESQDLELGCSQGLFERLDLADLPDGTDGSAAKEDFIPGTLHDCGVGVIVWSNIMAYNTSKFPGEKPSKVEDFFDLERFPGKRGISRRPIYTLEWALMADGVPVDKVYETLSTQEGIDRAFAKLDTIKDAIVVFEAGAQAPQLLADGEVSISSAFNGRIYSAIVDENQPLAIMWDSQIWNLDFFAIPKEHLIKVL
ncbi:ABC transporter substrate-binding protein [Castellaniella sp.]|uniref:ABC transporter substrate-binding protein n=1 Tax=Castellaniella sp. TaxID=1955812 RepID=UPI00356A639D